jgi:membrane fusion protein, multidrug efflux system
MGRWSSVAVSFVVTLTVLFTSACAPGGGAGEAAAAASGTGSGAPGGGATTAAVPVAVGRVVQKAMPLDLQVIGNVEPSSTVSVHAQITGQLTSVNFKEGDDVKQGQVLFTLDRAPLEAALKQAEANLQRDTAQAANAAAQAQRFVDLASRGIATKEQVETSRANADALTGTIAADRAALDTARIQLQYATIAAPISGRTGALMAYPGALVRANDTTPLVVINQLSPVNVSFAVPESQLTAIKQYMNKGALAVSAQAPGDAAPVSIGRLQFVDNAVDQTTGTIKAKASFANTDHRLWPGQFVNVTMTLSRDPNAIVVPTAAVQTGQQGAYVFVVKGDHTTELRSVTVGRFLGNETIILSGLVADETVVTDGHLRLLPGSHVVVKGESQRTEP